MRKIGRGRNERPAFQHDSAARIATRPDAAPWPSPIRDGDLHGAFADGGVFAGGLHVPDSTKGDTMTEVAVMEAQTKTAEERKELLAKAVANQVKMGWRVESQSDFQVVIVKGKRTNHILHLILTLVTLGLWAIVWICVAIFGGEKRAVISVDAYGKTHAQE